MSVVVLTSVSQITQARNRLRQRRLSGLNSAPLQFLKRVGVKLGLTRTVSVGDYIKSWDVLRTIEFVEKTTAPQSAILDIGTYASELPGTLYRLGYTQVTGIDLDSFLYRMPGQNNTHYLRANFLRTPFRAGSFSAITAISVIEHGFSGEALLSEVARLLKPGGHFIASFDYWPEKLETADQMIFGMAWRIFSRQEVIDFIQDANTHNLLPLGDVQLEAQQPVMHWGGKDYTFAWMALQKQPA